MKRKLWIVPALVLTLAVALAVLCGTAFADGPSGYCGADLTWYISDGTLVVRGSGAIPDYVDPTSGSSNIAPWYQYRSQIDDIDVREGVTEIGTWAFAGTGAFSYRLPLTLNRIGANSIDMHALTNFYYGGSEADFARILVEGYNTAYWTVYCRAGSFNGMYWQLTTDGCLALYVENSYFVPDFYMPNVANARVWKGFANEITHVLFSGNFRTVCPSAFWSLPNLRYVEFANGEKLSSIGLYAFEGCTALTDVYFSGSEEEWNAVTIEDGNVALKNAAKHYTSGSCGTDLTWTLYGGNLHIYGNGNMTDFGSISSAPWANSGYMVRTVTVDEGVLSIGANAFATCTGCTTVKLPNGLSMIHSQAFYSMPDLQNVYFDGSQAEWNAISLSLGNESLYGHVRMLRGSCGTYAQWRVSDGTLLITGSGAMDDFSNSVAPWSGLGQLFSQVIVDGPTSIGARAFSLMSNVESVWLKKPVETIRFNAFYGCANLIGVTGTGVSALQRIQAEAFRGCTKLYILNLPDPLPVIGTDAFLDCTRYLFTVSFDLNGHGSQTPPSQQVLRDRCVTLPDGPTAQGWVFTGWYRDAACTEEYHQNWHTVSSNFTLYAGWRLDGFNVYYSANGGSGQMADGFVLRGNTLTLPENGFTPPAGKSFKGWVVTGSDTVRKPGATITPTGNVIVTAQWYGPYTVSSLAGGGTGTMAPVEVAPDRYFTVPGCGFTPPEGAAFTYWRRSGDNQVFWAGNGNKIDGNMTLIAQYVGPYKVSFNAGGGTGNMSTATVGVGENYIFPLCTFTAPAGKTFSHWHVTGQDFETDITPANGLTNMSRSLTATAVWKTATVTLKAVDADGILITRTLTPDTDGCITFPDCRVIPPNGKRFDGWGPERYQPGQRLEIHGSTSFQAQWKLGYFTITFRTDGAAGDEYDYTIYATHYFTLPSAESWMSAANITPPAGMMLDRWEIPDAIGDVHLFYPGQTVRIIGDVEAIPLWIQAPPSTCTISFDPDDGSGTMDPITVPYGEPFTVPECGFNAPEGTKFAYWLGIGTGGLRPGDTAVVYEDKTLTALFGPLMEYTVSFYDLYGCIEELTVTEGECIPDPGLTYIPGYSFEGWSLSWYVQDEGGGSHLESTVIDFTVPIEYYVELADLPQNIIITAQRTEQLYTLTLDVSDGGTASVRDAQEFWQYGNGVYIECEAEEGCWLESITMVPETGDPVDVTWPDFKQPNFTMPDCNVTVQVVFHLPQYETGTCGDGLYWSLSEGGLLTVSGTGPMTNYNAVNNITPFKGSPKIIGVIFEEGVTSIGDYFLWDCTQLSYISLPPGLQRIGSGAFQGCTALTYIEIPDSVSSIGADAFSHTCVRSLTVPQSMTVIDRAAFRWMSELTELVIHDDVTDIGVSAFSQCESLPSVSLPANIDSIGYGAFGSCYAMENVYGLENVTSLGDYVFVNCRSLREVQLPRLDTIPYRTFDGCLALESIAVPDSVTAIGERAFNACGSLESIYYEGGHAMWDAIQIGSDNAPLEDAALYCKLAVTFETDGGTAVDGQLLDYAASPVRPEDPARTGCVFAGWYGDAALTEPYDFSTPLYEDVTVYAKWLGPDLSIALRLPAILTEIESQAFSGVSAGVVIVPQYVTSIAWDAFPSTVEVVMGFPGSAAEDWAVSHNVLFLPIDDAWLASH